MPSAKPWPEGAASHAVMNCGPPASHGGQATPACPKASQHGRTRVHGSHAYANSIYRSAEPKRRLGLRGLEKGEAGLGGGVRQRGQTPQLGQICPGISTPAPTSFRSSPQALTHLLLLEAASFLSYDL